MHSHFIHLWERGKKRKTKKQPTQNSSNGFPEQTPRKVSTLLLLELAMTVTRTGE